MALTPDVRVHIEELVLEGFAPSDRYWIGEAVERELARLLADGNLPPSLAAGGYLARVDGGSFELRPGATAEDIGSGVARRAHGGLAR
jgi:hypothetical protein